MHAGVGVQRRFGRGEGVEQRETRLALDVLVVPLEQELDRDGCVTGSVAHGLVSQHAEDRGGDPGLSRQRHPDCGA